MGQVKIYGVREHLLPIRNKLSDVLHGCFVKAFKYPQDKRIHRFFYLDQEDFIYSRERSNRYTIVEISLFEGRTAEAKKNFYQLIFDQFEDELGISANDVEITLTETPLHNWCIRGKAGDEQTFNYNVSV